MKFYYVDVKLCGTAYIVAEDETRAATLFKDQLQDAWLEADSSIFEGAPFAGMPLDGERVTLSPAMTCYGPWDDSELEEVDCD